MVIRQDPQFYSYDKGTLAHKVISYEHHEIHDGNHYFVSSYSSLASGGSLLFGVATSDTGEWLHMLFSFNATGATLFEIYEGATYVVSASVVSPVNSNRNSSNVSSASIQKCASFSACGNLLYSSRIGVTSNPVNSSGGTSRASHEMILKQGTKYLYRFQSFSASNVISYEGYYYEKEFS